MSTTYYGLKALIFVLLTFLIGVYTYYAVIDGVYFNVPVTFKYWDKEGEITHKTTKNVYKRGELVEARIVAHKDKLWPGIIHWTLVDGSRHDFPCRPGVLEVGWNDRIVLVEPVKDMHGREINIGEHYFTGVVEFELNSIKHKIYVPLQTNKFIVVE